MKDKLYIPVNVLETRDLVPGIGGKELTEIGIAAIVGVIISLVVYAMRADMIVCILIVIFTTVTTFIAVRRDNHNENMVDKLVQIYKYAAAQKRFEYEYRGIKSSLEEK